MRLSTRVAYNTIIQLVGKFFSIGLGLAAVAIMTRYLGQTGFGEYTTIITFLSFFAVAADMGLTLITVQTISRPDVNQEQALNNLFGLRLVTATCFMAIAVLVVAFFPYNQSIKLGVTIAAASFVFTALNQIMVGLFQKELRMDKATIAEIASRLALLFGVIITFYYRLGLNGILWSTVASSLVSFGLHFLLARKFSFIVPAFDFIFWQEIIKKSWPLALTIFFNLIYLRADTLILSLIKNSSVVGLYGAAYRVIDVLITIPFIFAGLILPVLVSSWAKKDEIEFRRVLQKSLDFMIILAMPMMIGTFFISTPIISLVAGNDFSLAGPILGILIIAAGAVFVGSIFSHAIIALDLQKKIIPAYLFTAITAVAGYLFFIPAYSYFGAAWVTVYSEITIAFFSFVLVWRYAKFRPNWSMLTKSTSAALLMAFSMFVLKRLFPDLNLVFSISFAVITYFAVLFACKGFKQEDLDILLNK